MTVKHKMQMNNRRTKLNSFTTNYTPFVTNRSKNFVFYVSIFFCLFQFQQLDYVFHQILVHANTVQV